MKKILLSACIALIASMSARGQTTISTLAPSAVASSANVTKVTNDFRNLFAVGWDGTAPGVYYVLPTGTPGSFTLPAGISEPDLAISLPPGNGFTDAFIFVVGKMPNNVFILNRYKLQSNGTFAQVGTNSYNGSNGGAQVTSINIDATLNGDYAIAMGYTNGAVRVWSGTYANLLATNGGYTQIGVLPSGSGSQVDVCVGSGTGYLPTNVHVSYLSPGGTEVRCNQLPFAGGAWAGTTVAAPSQAGVVYQTPRIAAPHINPCTGPNDLFSIAYRRNSGGSSNIYQFSNDPNNVTYTTNLTSGIAPFPTPAINNVSGPPAITFEKGLLSMGNCYAGTATAWEMPSGSVSTLIGQRVNTNNTPWGATEYLTISPAAATDARCLAVSGSDAGQLLFSYWSNGQIYIKLPGSTGATF